MNEKDTTSPEERRSFFKATLAGTAAVVAAGLDASAADRTHAAAPSDPMPGRLAEVGYSKETREIQMVVPNGFRVADLAKYMEFFARDVFSKLPRGCTACTSGDHLIIRERLENVIRVDLEQRMIVR